MNETAEDREFYEAAEAAFIRRRGTPFLLSPGDFALLQSWRALGVPLAAVEAGIDDAFRRREERGAVGRVNSLSYCRDAVLEAWERRRETSLGKGSAPCSPTAEAVRPALAALAEALEALRRRREDLAVPLDSALRSLKRLADSDQPAEAVEAALARLDRRLARELADTLPDAERGAIDEDVRRLLGGAGARMDPATLEKTSRALTRRAVRERLELPRLSLL